MSNPRNPATDAKSNVDPDKGLNAEELLLRGLNYYSGTNNYPTNEEQAFNYFEKASFAENPKGRITEFFNGIKFFYGVKGKKDNGKAFMHFQKSAEAGLAIAQYWLGHMYHGGYGVGEYLKAAAEWYRKAADQGHALAQQLLGVAYEYGVNGIAKDEKDQKAAIEWYQKAARQGNARAMEMLGKLYRTSTENGIKNLELSAWYSRLGYMKASSRTNLEELLRQQKDYTPSDALAITYHTAMCLPEFKDNKVSTLVEIAKTDPTLLCKLLKEDQERQSTHPDLDAIYASIRQSATTMIDEVNKMLVTTANEAKNNAKAAAGRLTNASIFKPDSGTGSLDPGETAAPNLGGSKITQKATD